MRPQTIVAQDVTVDASKVFELADAHLYVMDKLTIDQGTLKSDGSVKVELDTLHSNGGVLEISKNSNVVISANHLLGDSFVIHLEKGIQFGGRVDVFAPSREFKKLSITADTSVQLNLIPT